jgi:hypothetical protein
MKQYTYTLEIVMVRGDVGVESVISKEELSCCL